QIAGSINASLTGERPNPGHDRGRGRVGGERGQRLIERRMVEAFDALAAQIIDAIPDTREARQPILTSCDIPPERAGIAGHLSDRHRNALLPKILRRRVADTRCGITDDPGSAAPGEAASGAEKSTRKRP